MAYATYNDYKDIYFGNVISSDDFPRLSERASEKIDKYTMYRLDDELPCDKKLAKKIIKATCAIAEILANTEQINALSGTDAEGKGKIVVSESIGAKTRTYKVQENLLQQKITETGEDNALYAVAYEYLAGTGLLYRGLI